MGCKLRNGPVEGWEYRLKFQLVGRVVGAVVVGAAVCGRIPGLAKSQREQCRKAPHAMPAVGEGAELGLRECRHQFRHHRWNCSHVANDQVFGHVVVVGKDCSVTAASPLFITQGGGGRRGRREPTRSAAFRF
ncbi:hypothetical protein K0M31_014096 [Melipona bicolor]|uniref:Protein Wnt n=1 Tax=Melipona bicolor TaxID=60889 RepID=A0AA40KU31_9HYME|nr:hypothetical protein K0M31_014096 [Melipona bicolor]